MSEAGNDVPVQVTAAARRAAQAEAEAAVSDDGDHAAFAADAPAPLVIHKRGRRVTTDAAPGTVQEPGPEQHQSTENDARLRGDKPPHWG